MAKNQDAGYIHSFPSVRGMQGGEPFYISMCPARVIPKIFSFDEDEVPPQLRAQRTLNRARIPEIANYLIEAGGKTYSRQIDRMPSAEVIAEIEREVDQAHLERMLMSEGVAKFADPHKALIALIGEKRQALAA